MRHITHILLLDEDGGLRNAELSENCLSVAKHISRSSLSNLYTVVVPIPESRTDCIRLATELEARIKSTGIPFVFRPLPREDLTMGDGKVGLIASSLWATSGAILLNDVPIALQTIERLLELAAELAEGGEELVLRKSGWLTFDYHIGLLAGGRTISHLLMRKLFNIFAAATPLDTVEDILRFMKSNCEKGELRVAQF